METVDNLSIDRPQLLPIKQRWNFMLITVLAALLAQVVQIMQAMKIQDLVTRYNEGDVGAAYTFAEIGKMDPLGILAGLVGILAIVSVCMWIFRIAQNVHLAGVQYLNYTPGWHVGWFFIPFVQLVMPFICMRELWKSNSVINDRSRYDKWMDQSLSPFVVLWYVSFLLMIGVAIFIGFSNFSLMQRMALDPDAMVEYFASVPRQTYMQVPLHTLEGICLILFAKKMTATQEELINS